MRHAFGIPAMLLLAACSAAPIPMSSTPPRPFVLLAHGAGGIDIGEGHVRILAEGKDTGGTWSALERTEPPGTRTALHRHNHMDEAFYVVEGTLSVFIDGRLRQLEAGSFVLIPSGTPHAQGNAGPREVKIVSFFSPPGWEQSARARARLHAEHPAGSAGFAERIGKVYADFDIEVLGPSPIPREPRP